MKVLSYFVPTEESPNRITRPRQDDDRDFTGINPEKVARIRSGTPHIVFTRQTEVLAESDEEERFLDTIEDALALSQIVGGAVDEAVRSALANAERDAT